MKNGMPQMYCWPLQIFIDQGGREGAVHLSCILKVEESWMHSYHARIKFEIAENHSLMLPQKRVVRKSQGTLKVMDDMFFYE